MRLVTLVAGLAVGSPVWAGIEGVQLGELVPPATIGGVAVRPVPFDTRIFADVYDVPDGYNGLIRFVGERGAMSCRQIGLGWATWSHGWTGNAYYANGGNEATVYFRAGTKAVYLYAEPGPFGRFAFTVTATDGNSTVAFTEDVEGQAGAKGWGFYGTDGSDVKSVHVAGPVSIAIGEFATSEPCYADINMDGYVDFLDYLEFLNFYDAADPRVDFNKDGLVDFSDYLEFLNLYGNSCEDN